MKTYLEPKTDDLGSVLQKQHPVLFLRDTAPPSPSTSMSRRRFLCMTIWRCAWTALWSVWARTSICCTALHSCAGSNSVHGTCGDLPIVLTSMDASPCLDADSTRHCIRRLHGLCRQSHRWLFGHCPGLRRTVLRRQRRNAIRESVSALARRDVGNPCRNHSADRRPSYHYHRLASVVFVSCTRETGAASCVRSTTTACFITYGATAAVSATHLVRNKAVSSRPINSAQSMWCNM